MQYNICQIICQGDKDSNIIVAKSVGLIMCITNDGYKKSPTT